jgi:hypothetical protein
VWQEKAFVVGERGGDIHDLRTLRFLFPFLFDTMESRAEPCGFLIWRTFLFFFPLQLVLISSIFSVCVDVSGGREDVCGDAKIM